MKQNFLGNRNEVAEEISQGGIKMDYMDAFKESEKRLQNENAMPTSGQPVIRKKPSPSQLSSAGNVEPRSTLRLKICPKCGVRTDIYHPGSNAGFSFKKLIAGYIEKFWCLSPFLKIVAGFLTSLFVAPFLISIFVFVSSLLSAGLMYGSMYGGARDIGFALIFSFVLVLLGWVGAVLIEGIGFVMIVYGVRDIWREKEWMRRLQIKSFYGMEYMRIALSMQK